MILINIMKIGDFMKKKNKQANKLLNRIDIAVTILYTLVFCYCVYVLIVIPESLDINNFILLGILVIPYLIRLFGKNMIPATIALEILFIIIAGVIYVTWPSIKTSIDYDCGWGETD